MTLEEMTKAIERCKGEQEYVSGSLNNLLPEKIKTAKHVIGLVSGEYHPGVYNGSRIIMALRERFSGNKNEVLPRIIFVGGPIVLKGRGKSVYQFTNYGNDVIGWLKENITNHPAITQVYKSLSREDIHFWFVDDYVTYQIHHHFGSELKDRKTYRVCNCPNLVSWLIKYVQKKHMNGDFERLSTTEDLDKYVYLLWKKDSRGERILPDKEAARRNLLNFLNAVPKPEIYPLVSDLSVRHDDYI